MSWLEFLNLLGKAAAAVIVGCLLVVILSSTIDTIKRKKGKHE